MALRRWIDYGDDNVFRVNFSNSKRGQPYHLIERAVQMGGAAHGLLLIAQGRERKKKTTGNNNNPHRKCGSIMHAA